MMRPIDLLPELKLPDAGGQVSPLSFLASHARSDTAVAYIALFWPEFILFEGYIFRSDFKEDVLRSWERQANVTRQNIEAAINYLDIGYLFGNSPEETSDLTYKREMLLRSTIVDIYGVKLARDFPDRSFKISLETDDTELALTFCQA